MKLIAITSPYTGSGKTLVSLALLSRLNGARSFKIGPDFIDTQIHSRITGSRSATVDRWIQGPGFVNVPCSADDGHDYGIVEGVMGYYDSGAQVDTSTHYHFRKLGIPYILVINVSAMAESAYHVARGFMGKGFLGVIINDYYSEKHLQMVLKPFREHGIAVLGSIPHNEDFKLPERHLGISTDIPAARVRSLAESAGRYINTDFVDRVPDHLCGEMHRKQEKKTEKKIWVALDDAFSFYYESSLQALAGMGELNYFSPLCNEVPEDPGLVYIGGGYPELYADKLAENTKTISALAYASESGIPVIAECGGLMYLESEMEADSGKLKLVGIFDGIVRKNSALTLSYTKLVARRDNLLFRKGETAYGHEFHYSSISDQSEKMMRNVIGRGIDGNDGLQVRKTFGSYSHFDLARYSKRIESLLH